MQELFNIIAQYLQIRSTVPLNFAVIVFADSSDEHYDLASTANPAETALIFKKALQVLGTTPARGVH